MVTDPVFAAKNMISAIRPYCDVIIILSHLGLTLDKFINSDDQCR